MLASLLALLLALPAGTDPARQFDFWIGEWSVQNRHLQPDGTWLDGDVTRARITPVCGGRAILEEWAGPFHGGFMNGFSLRAYDPARADWDLILYWTTDGNAGFGHLRGRFRHGRGEFFAGGGPNLTRYTFSDALADSVRWDSAVTRDGGQTWKTDWIMEFSRTRAAAEVTQDRLFDVAWSEGRVSPHPEARLLDWMLGEWRGIQTDAATGVEREARLRAKLLDKDCLVLDLLETRAPGQPDWSERLAVRGFVAQRGAWEAHTVAEDDPVIRAAVGRPEPDLARFDTGLSGGGLRRETLRRLEDGALVIEVEERASAGEELRLRTVTELRPAVSDNGPPDASQSRR